MPNLLNLIDNKKLTQDLYEIASEINNQRNLGKLIETPFTIGVMGKSGAGKSTIINALCQKNACQSGGVGGCTRKIQKVSATFGDMPIILVDFPGIAESEKWNESYIKLYENYLEQIDVLLWVIKLDDRSLVEDEIFFKEHIKYKFEGKTIFVLSQADKAEPTREWNNQHYLPSEKQKNIIQQKIELIFNMFATKRGMFSAGLLWGKGIEHSSIVPISVDSTQHKFKTYNFIQLLEVILLKLATDSASFGYIVKSKYIDKLRQDINGNYTELKEDFGEKCSNNLFTCFWYKKEQ